MDTRHRRRQRLKEDAEEQMEALAGEENMGAPAEAPVEEPMESPAEAPQVLATNRTICLICTLASMLSLFALFLVFAERRSRAIRHFSVQSVGLAAAHLGGGLVLLALGALLRPIPILGYVTTLTFLLIYVAILIAALVLRVKMMLYAWRGWRFELPIWGQRLQRYL